MTNNRIETGQLGNRPQLRPAQRAVDTYVQPARPVEDQSTDGLLDALGFFNQNLAQLSATQRQDRAKADQLKAQHQANAIARANGTAAAEVARTGMIGGEPLANARLKKVAGDVDGGTFAASLRQELEPMDLTGMDVEAFIRGRAEERLKSIKDPFIIGGFVGHINNLVGWAKNQQAAQGLRDREQTVRSTTFAHLQGKVNEWVGSGAAPEQVVANVGAYYQEIGAGRDRITTPEMLDHHVMTIAAQLMATNPEAATALLERPRGKAVDGAERGSLLIDPGYSSQAASLIQQGKVVMAKRQQAEAFATRRRENFARVVGAGGQRPDWSAFQDVSVGGQTLTAKEQEAQFLDDLNRNLDQRVAAGEISPQQKTAEVRRYASHMDIGLAPGKWRALLKDRGAFHGQAAAPVRQRVRGGGRSSGGDERTHAA